MKVLPVSVALVMLGINALCQGTIQFDNLYTIYYGVDAPVFHSDHVTPLSGSQFQAELLVGLSASNLAFVAVTGFDGDGYFFGGTQAIAWVPERETAWVRVQVWNTSSGATFAQAQASGLPDSWYQSSVFPVQTGCPDCIPPSDPGALTGLGFSALYLNSVPEPSAVVLAGLGFSLAVLRLPKRCRHELLLFRLLRPK